MAEIHGVKFDSLETIPDLIAYASAKYNTRNAISYFKDKTVIVSKNYLELHLDVMKMAYYIKSLNLKSKNICLIGECSYEWIVSFYALSWAGFIPVLIDSELSGDDIYELMVDVESTIVILDNSKKRSVLLENAKRTGIATIDLYDDISPNNTLYPSVRSYLHNSDEKTIACAKWAPEDTGLIVFTSGTTGKHKAVMLSHKNLCADLFVSYFLAGQGKHYSTIAILPVHHMLQLTTGIQTPIYVGCPICIGRGKRFISQSIKQFTPSILILVPSVIEMMRKKIWADIRLKKREKHIKVATMISQLLMKCHIDIRRHIFADIHSALGGNLKTIISGGAPIDKETVQEFRRWGINIFNGYGITECSPVVSCNRISHQRDGSVGMVDLEPYCSVKIIDGEICVSGEIVMKGYYNDIETTNQVIKNGWFMTGDLGYIDSDNYLFITGRKKNLIILSNGENVSPEELELIYSKIDGVKDIIVYSKEIEHDNILAAIVVPDETTMATVENIQAYFEEKFNSQNSALPPYKRIYEVNIREKDFVKSSNGKVKRIKENYTSC